MEGTLSGQKEHNYGKKKKEILNSSLVWNCLEPNFGSSWFRPIILDGNVESQENWNHWSKKRGWGFHRKLKIGGLDN